jgi:hypothetical protein
MPQLTDPQTATLEVYLRHLQEQPRSVGLDPDTSATLQAIVGKMRETVRPVAVEVDAILNDPKLSDQGKQTAQMAVGPRVVGNFANLGRVLRENDAAITRGEKLLFGPITQAPPGNEVVTFLREDAIRRTTGKARANAEFQRALNDDDLETARALLNAPGPKWLSPDKEREGKASYAQRTDPEGWQRLQALDELRKNLSTIARQVAAWLVHLGASPARVQMLKATDKEVRYGAVEGGN